MGTREELHKGNMGVMTCLMALNDYEVAFLVKAVPERGADLWVRFRTWQRDGHVDQGFDVWVREMAQAGVAAQLFQPKPATTPPLQNGLHTQSPRGVTEGLKSQVRQILRTATSKEDAKERIRSTVKRALNPRPPSCSVVMSWSSNADQRSVHITPQGYEPFTVTTRS